MLGMMTSEQQDFFDPKSLGLDEISFMRNKLQKYQKKIPTCVKVSYTTRQSFNGW